MLSCGLRAHCCISLGARQCAANQHLEPSTPSAVTRTCKAAFWKSSNLARNHLSIPSALYTLCLSRQEFLSLRTQQRPSSVCTDRHRANTPLMNANVIRVAGVLPSTMTQGLPRLISCFYHRQGGGLHPVRCTSGLWH